MVSDIISNLDTHKVNGGDGIPVVVMKKYASELAPVFSKRYNYCLADFCFPACWKSSSVVSVHKNPGKHSNLSNYLPPNLPAIFAKTFEALIKAGVVKHLRSEDLHSDKQYGFFLSFIELNFSKMCAEFSIYSHLIIHKSYTEIIYSKTVLY